jgi:hypothetical protein
LEGALRSALFGVCRRLSVLPERLCHLTATGPTTERSATVENYLAQDDVVLAHLDRMKAVHGRPGLINVNLMAWGELLANPHFLSGWHALAEALEKRAGQCGMGLQLNARPSCRPTWIRPSFPAALATCARLRPSRRWWGDRGARRVR